jgi:hypothetical protein
MNLQAVLCYVVGDWAYFTTQALDQQQGEGWAKFPYEHNAGLPYEARPEKGEDWEIVAVAFSGLFDRPCDHHLNSPYTVEKINKGAIPWLSSNGWDTKEVVYVKAGTTLRGFIDLIYRGGGKVYVEYELYVEYEGDDQC